MDTSNSNSAGHLHLHSKALQEAYKIFTELGFSIGEGPEVEDEHHNFDALNIPADHPSRDMQDTFWLKKHLDSEGRRTLLRTQTSSIQIRFMENHKAPFKVVGAGRVFRNEATDRTHEAQFYQIEGMYVDTEVNMGMLKGVLTDFYKKFFGGAVEIRFRPSYFPFVEPGVEVDILFNGKWLEVTGAGMVHPKVLEAGGVDPKKYQGFAFGIGFDRLLMIRHGITDIRQLYNGDLRFVTQF